MSKIVNYALGILAMFLGFWILDKKNSPSLNLINQFLALSLAWVSVLIFNGDLHSFLKLSVSKDYLIDKNKFIWRKVIFIRFILSLLGAFFTLFFINFLEITAFQPLFFIFIMFITFYFIYQGIKKYWSLSILVLQLPTSLANEYQKTYQVCMSFVLSFFISVGIESIRCFMIR